MTHPLPVLDEPCVACDGDGTVANPEFAALERRYEEREQECLAAGNGLSAWRASVDCRDLEAEYEHITELIDCLDCKGAGSIPTEAGRTVLAFMNRHRR
jgi:hypothetical protein